MSTKVEEKDKVFSVELIEEQVAPQEFAQVAWITADIIDKAEVYTEEQAAEFLSSNEKYIREAMVCAGWEAIEVFLSEAE